VQPHHSRCSKECSFQPVAHHPPASIRPVDGATSADVLASQIAEVERAKHIILSAGGDDALENIDLLEEVIE
jgi:hypothetical protein